MASHADPAAAMSENPPRGSRSAARQSILTPKAIADIRDDTVRGLKQREIAVRADLTNVKNQHRAALNE